MVTSSGYFVPPEPQAATPGEDLELMYESKDGPCQLLKGHKNDRIVVYKVLKPAFRDEPVYQRLLRREYEIRHPVKEQQRQRSHAYEQER